jgi:hypothetical protein
MKASETMLDYKTIYNAGTLHHHVNQRQDDFGEVPINTVFVMGGNVWRKRSTRTAEIVEPVRLKGIFYFDKSDLVKTVYKHNYTIKRVGPKVDTIIDVRFVDAYVDSTVTI